LPWSGDEAANRLYRRRSVVHRVPVICLPCVGNGADELLRGSEGELLPTKFAEQLNYFSGVNLGILLCQPLFRVFAKRCDKGPIRRRLTQYWRERKIVRFRCSPIAFAQGCHPVGGCNPNTHDSWQRFEPQFLRH